MTAATKNREGERQPSDLCPYSGASGYHYYKHTFLMHKANGTGIAPLVQGAGCSGAHFIGVAANEVDQSGGLGASQMTLNVWKEGEFTFAHDYTGTSADIGLRAYGLDDQTIGTSAAAPCLSVGEIVGLVGSCSSRVRIDNAVNEDFLAHGVSWGFDQN